MPRNNSPERRAERRARAAIRADSAVRLLRDIFAELHCQYDPKLGCTVHSIAMVGGSGPNDWLILGEIMDYPGPKLLGSYPDRAKAEAAFDLVTDCEVIRRPELTNWAAINRELASQVGS